MAKIFHIYVDNGSNRFAEVDLPASDYEMLDLVDRLRLELGQPPCMEVLKCQAFDYLAEYLPELPDVFQLNALARQLDTLDAQGMAALEGLVRMETQKGAVPIPQLIDYAYSADCCHVVPDAVNDYELGKFLAENGFVPEAEDLSEAAFALLDFSKIGREHREAESGVFTSLGYVERHSEPHRVSETMDFQPRKPAYTILLNLAALPLNGEIRPEDMIQLRLPAPEEQVRETLEKLGAKDWNGAVASIWDCPVPRLCRGMHLSEEIPQILKLAQRLRELDNCGKMTTYKALLEHFDCQDIPQALSFAGAAEEYIFDPETSSPEDVGLAELNTMVGSECAAYFARYVDLQAFGCALLERDHAAVTEYGLIERQDGRPVQTMENGPRQGGMEMT